tara:strand:+ start:76 stop:480 length:405 start_codon:yes stop_codon:yes gene_type:complete
MLYWYKKKYFFKELYRSEKIRFLYYGFFNTLITNLILQILLIFSKVYFATLIAQIFNLLFGFFIYKKKVFRKKYISKNKKVFYIITAFTSWNLNWIIINFLTFDLYIPKNLSAIISLPLIAAWSYLIQKLIIFK